DPNLKPDYSERFHISGYNRIQQEEAYKLYEQWKSPNFPRYLVAQINHANPYYDDSYAVDSANLGPYGAAIETELIPPLEKQSGPAGRAGPDLSGEVRPAAGNRWRCRFSIRSITTAPLSPAPIPSTFVPTPTSTSIRTRTPSILRARRCNCRSLAIATTRDTC